MAAFRQELATGMSKKRRSYQPRIVGDKVTMPADLKRLHKYTLDVEHIGIISDEMRKVVEELTARAGTQAAAEAGRRGKVNMAVRAQTYRMLPFTS
jgi:hypothetical protein